MDFKTVTQKAEEKDDIMYLDRDIQRLNKKLERLEIYKYKKQQIVDEEKRILGKVRVLRYFPMPKQFITLLMMFVVMVVVAVMWTQIFYYAAQVLRLDIPTVTNGLMVSVAINIFVIFAALIVWRNTKDFTYPALKAKLKRKPLVDLITKNRTKRLIVPQEVTQEVWDIDDDLAVIPDPDAVLIGGNHIPIMEGIPELGVGFNPRKLVEGQDLNVDMTAIKLYAKTHEQRAYRNIRTGMDVVKPMIMPLVIVISVLLVLAPIALKMLNDNSRQAALEDDILRYRKQLVDNHITPWDEVKPESSTPTTQTTLANPSNPAKPASTGVSIK